MNNIVWTPVDALEQALYLSVTAPTAEKSKMALEIGEQIASGLSELDVARAKFRAEQRLTAE